jgi:hypothetical protein
VAPGQSDGDGEEKLLEMELRTKARTFSISLDTAVSSRQQAVGAPIRGSGFARDWLFGLASSTDVFTI